MRSPISVLFFIVLAASLSSSPAWTTRWPTTRAARRTISSSQQNKERKENTVNGHLELMKQDIIKGCATLATCASLFLGATAGTPTTASAAVGNVANPTIVEVNVDVPYVLNTIETKETRIRTINWVKYIVESIENLFGPAVSINFPTKNYGLIAREILSGDATIKVNGEKVDLQVIESKPGVIQIQIENELIPAIPFAGLPTTPSIVTKAEYAVADQAPAVVGAVESIERELQQQKQGEFFWDRPVSDRLRLGFAGNRPVTYKDVVGAGSLGLGAAYGLSFGYYSYNSYQENKEAEERKNKMKKKKATKKKEEPLKATSATKDSSPSQDTGSDDKTQEPPAITGNDGTSSKRRSGVRKLLSKISGKQ